MILIIGGYNQGKTDYAKKYFGLNETEIIEASQPINKLINAKCIRYFEKFVSNAIDNNENSEELTLKLISENSDAVIIMTEIGCGIIPIEKSERIYREYVGKVGCLLAERAEKVIRLICGIPTVIKGE